MLVFPDAWAMIGERVRTDVPVLLKGGYSKRDSDAENPTFIVESVTPFTELRYNGQISVALEVSLGSNISPEVMADVRAVVETHPGPSPLEVRWSDGNGTRARLRSKSLKLAATSAALNELRALLGDERVRLVRGS